MINIKKNSENNIPIYGNDNNRSRDCVSPANGEKFSLKVWRANKNPIVCAVAGFLIIPRWKWKSRFPQDIGGISDYRVADNRREEF